MNILLSISNHHGFLTYPFLPPFPLLDLLAPSTIPLNFSSIFISILPSIILPVYLSPSLLPFFIHLFSYRSSPFSSPLLHLLPLYPSQCLLFTPQGRGGKMSGSIGNSAVFLTDTPKQVITCTSTYPIALHSFSLHCASYHSICVQIHCIAFLHILIQQLLNCIALHCEA